MTEYHNPEAQFAAAITPYELSAYIKGASAIKVGFLANGFPDSESFLSELAAAMQAIEPSIEVLAYNKGNPTVPANEDMLVDISQHCSAAVAVCGH